jgi:hypothetical protein
MGNCPLLTVSEACLPNSVVGRKPLSLPLSPLWDPRELRQGTLSLSVRLLVVSASSTGLKAVYLKV